MLNIDRSDWIRQICKSYDLNPTRLIVKKNLQPNPSHQPLQNDPTQLIGLDWIGLVAHSYLKFSWETNTQKTQKIQLKTNIIGKIINPKTPIFSNPRKIIS